ncbi:hypothetical protein ASE90_05295 [Sphingomonas sp. Leaf67]|jgi:hypothetical protein|uniref:hypothetical protein n=1 Tax=Sphingomonas sp. Leaf67 TaxID=1736230 RepID=UPI0006F3A5FD|nr:hypothetical protein [Sphingomonas sp. Leaf67]KQN92144.1 hypothetical protein ASE90_05295 [Sphingomonas sp. Leaf67]
MIPHTIDPATETYFFKMSALRGHHMLFVTQAMETQNPCTPLWVGACPDERSLNAFARWLAVRRDEWAAWGRQVESTGYEAFDRYLRARIGAEPYGEADATIVRIAQGSREVIIGQSVSGPFGYGEEMLYRHVFRTPKARKRFLAWLDRDGSLSRMHELVALAFHRGTAALGEALDEIADRSGTGKPSGEQRRQPQSLQAG